MNIHFTIKFLWDEITMLLLICVYQGSNNYDYGELKLLGRALLFSIFYNDFLFIMETLNVIPF